MRTPAATMDRLPADPTRWQGHAMLWIFAASGFSGLIYQSIWTQYMGLFLGHSAHAQSLVLMLFMGGMALGAWLASLRSEALRRPLLAYAAIELAIGVLGIGFDPAYRAGTEWAYQLMQTSGGGGVRWAVAVALVFPQCVLLGATFPLMSAGYMRLQPACQGSILAGLYFSNSIGAALGAMASTYLLLPAVGLPGAILAAGILNVVVAIAAYPLGKQAARTGLMPDADRSSAPAAPLLVLAVAALTGASSFVYEVTWVRMLSMALGTTLHAFELMLAAFITGLAFGGLWLRSRADRLRSPLATAGWVQLWMGLAALGSMFVYANAFEWVGWLMRVIAHTAEGYSLYNFACGAIALAVMFPAAFFAGMTLPLLTLSLLQQGGGERAIGRIYAANTLGAIMGVVVAVHLLLPLAGLKMALSMAAGVDLSLAVILLIATRETGTANLRRAALAAMLGGTGMALALSMVRFDPRMLASSVYRHGTTSIGDARMLYYRDGKTASVAVYENASGRRSIATNGKVDAGLMMDGQAPPSQDEYTMALLASLPLSMRDRYDRVGVIGFGSGMTTHYLLGSPRVGHVDTVEIEPMMVEGARLFRARVPRAFGDPRSRVVIDDARAFFSSSPDRYDLIVSEPSNPWMGGTASLFSDEFYGFVPRHLARGGLFVQWLQLYEMEPALVGSVLRALLPHFEDVHAYLANQGDLLLVASPKGGVPSPGRRLFTDEALRPDLARLGILDVRDLQDGFVLDKRGLEAYAGLYSAPANSDFFPYLQLRAPVARFMNASVDLATIQVLPWPLSRYLGNVPTRTSMQRLPAHRKPLQLDAHRRLAVELDELLAGRPWNGADFTPSRDTHEQALALRSLGRECHLEDAPERSIRLILSVAGLTIPYLDQRHLKELWGDRDWMACEPVRTRVVEAIALVSAAAENRHRDVLKHGEALLAGAEGDALASDPISGRYVVGAMLLAAIAADRPEAALRLYQNHWSRLGQATQQDSALLITLALATAAPPGSPTSTGLR